MKLLGVGLPLALANALFVIFIIILLKVVIKKNTKDTNTLNKLVTII